MTAQSKKPTQKRLHNCVLSHVNERLKLTRFQRLNLTHLLWRKAPSRAALK